MFRSKIGALIFMGFILFAVFRVVGTEENGGELATAGERITAQREAFEAQQIDANEWDAGALRDDGWGDGALPSEG